MALINFEQFELSEHLQRLRTDATETFELLYSYWTIDKDGFSFSSHDYKDIVRTYLEENDVFYEDLLLNELKDQILRTLITGDAYCLQELILTKTLENIDIPVVFEEFTNLYHAPREHRLDFIEATRPL